MRDSRLYVNYPVPTSQGTPMPMGLLEDWNLHNPYEPMYQPTQVPGYPGFAGDPVNLGLLEEPKAAPAWEEGFQGSDVLQQAPKSDMAGNFKKLAGMMSETPQDRLPTHSASAPGVWQGGKHLDITPYLRQFGRRG